MSDEETKVKDPYGIHILRREVARSQEPHKGMQAGLPKVTVCASHAAHAVAAFDALATEKAGLEQRLVVVNESEIAKLNDRLIAEKCADTESIVALIADRDRFRAALEKIAVRPTGHHDCDDYTRGYGQCKADMANIASAALSPDNTKGEQT
jgi:hypothetical protein